MSCHSGSPIEFSIEFRDASETHNDADFVKRGDPGANRVAKPCYQVRQGMARFTAFKLLGESASEDTYGNLLSPILIF